MGLKFLWTVSWYQRRGWFFPLTWGDFHGKSIGPGQAGGVRRLAFSFQGLPLLCDTHFL